MPELNSRLRSSRTVREIRRVCASCLYRGARAAGGARLGPPAVTILRRLSRTTWGNKPLKPLPLMVASSPTRGSAMNEILAEVPFRIAMMACVWCIVISLLFGPVLGLLIGLEAGRDARRKREPASQYSVVIPLRAGRHARR